MVGMPPLKCEHFGSHITAYICAILCSVIGVQGNIKNNEMIVNWRFYAQKNSEVFRN